MTNSVVTFTHTGAGSLELRKRSSTVADKLQDAYVQVQWHKHVPPMCYRAKSGRSIR